MWMSISRTADNIIYFGQAKCWNLVSKNGIFPQIMHGNYLIWGGGSWGLKWEDWSHVLYINPESPLLPHHLFISQCCFNLLTHSEHACAGESYMTWVSGFSQLFISYVTKILYDFNQFNTLRALLWPWHAWQKLAFVSWWNDPWQGPSFVSWV